MKFVLQNNRFSKGLQSGDHLLSTSEIATSLSLKVVFCIRIFCHCDSTVGLCSLGGGVQWGCKRVGSKGSALVGMDFSLLSKI